MDFIYVVSLAGNDVFHDWAIQFAIRYIDDVKKARDIIKDKYGIEFEEKSASFTNGYWRFDNITDDRDVYLIVERVDIIK